MTTLYLIRHAETVANTEERLCGMSETDLSDYGFEQIKKLAHHAKSLNIDVVYTSPLKRAYKTAAALNWYIDRPLHIVHDLHEISFGSIEGMLWKDIKAHKDWNDFSIDRFTVYGGESYEHAYHRIVNAINDIIKDTDNENKTIAIVSHGAVLRDYLCYVNGWLWDRFNDLDRISNAGMTKIIYDNKCQKFTIIFQNYDSHLEIIHQKFSTGS